VKYVGIYTNKYLCFYIVSFVVISRVTSREGMKILISDEYDENTNVTSNVIYKEIFCIF
jgi:ATP-dependent DNA helicase PIF1